ncbi:MAG: alpha/beta hydrolase [Bacteroidota bacterium]
MSAIKSILISLVLLYLVVGFLLFALQEQFIFLPEKLERDYQFSFKHPFTEHFLTTPEDGEIHLLYFESDSSKGTILYFHGNAGSLRRWGEVAQPFIELGFEIIISDYRSYGKSTGQLNQQALLSDADAIYEFAKNISNESDLILFGRSLGSGFASYLAGKNQPRQLILETPFYSLNDVAQKTFFLFPTKLFLRYQLNNAAYLEGSTLPITLFHGTADNVVPYASGLKLAKTLDPEKYDFITIENGGHNDLGSYPMYWEEMEKVLTAKIN